MISVIKGLMEGKSFGNEFSKAQVFWSKFFEAHSYDDESALTNALGEAQSGFERALDMNRALAKELMAVTALAHLYNEQEGFGGNRELAQRLVNAFERSMVSLEVKGKVLQVAAKMFWLDPPSKG